MADDTDSTDLNALMQLIDNGAQAGLNYAGGQQANAITQAAYQAVLGNLQKRFNDYDKLNPAAYKDIAAQQLGPSSLAGIQPDAQARTQEEAAISQLQDIADRGGLSLADMQALNEVQANLNRNNSARQAGLANQYAARGQLGSGAQLAMDLANQQNAAQSANQQGESAAAQAQQRAMQAILQKAQASRTMSNDDYQRKLAAAQAADAIAKYNASARTDASKYNNTVAGQSYADQLSKLKGQTALTDSMNGALLGSANANANTTKANAGYGAGLVGTLPSIFKGMGGGGGGKSSGSTAETDPFADAPGNGDVPDAPGTQNTKDFNANLQPDPNETGGDFSSSNGNDGFDPELLDEGGSFA